MFCCLILALTMQDLLFHSHCHPLAGLVQNLQRRYDLICAFGINGMIRLQVNFILVYMAKLLSICCLLVNRVVSLILPLQVPLSAVTSIIDGLKRLYTEKLKPLEVTYQFNDFVSPLLVSLIKAAFTLTSS